MGTSAVMVEVRALVRQAALSMDPVLVFGEAGTGKELTAQTIHALSARSAGPFSRLGCYAISDLLFEAELFGAVEGFFGGPAKQGRIEQAEGGTLVIEGVECLSPAAQLKLLRLVQRKEYSPLGSTETLKFDVRLIASSICPLPQLVNAGTFREDL